jgi:hypothetical protein
VDPWRDKDWVPALGGVSEEYITRKEGKGKLLVSVLPAVYSCIERKEDFEFFTREDPSDVFFVLMPRVESVPPCSRAYPRHAGFLQRHKASPCEIQLKLYY